MAFYRQVGEVPPKRHTQFRRPDGGLYYEELIGEEGFSSDSSLLYHRGIPSAIVDARAVGAARPDAHAQPPAAAAAPEAARPVPRRGAQGHRRRHRPAAGARQRRRPHLLRRVAGDLAALPQRHRRRVRLRRARARRPSRPSFGALEVGQGDYVILPRDHHAPLGPDRRRAAAHLRHRGQQPHRPAQALPVPLRAVPRARPVLRARPARAQRSRSLAEGSDVEVYVKHRGDGPGGLAGTDPRRTRSTRSTWSAGTAASTRTRSTSPTSSRSPAGCTSRRRCTRSSRATTS